MKRHYVITHGEIILKPYLKEYVKEYQSWMQDPELLQFTGSEYLTLEEEYQNQQSWIKDQSKYTFLIFDKSAEKQQLIGDVNLFFSQWIENNQAQINIMIAKKSHRSKGLASKVLKIIEDFSASKYSRPVIIAKIKKQNIASIKFFEKHGYKCVNYNSKFQQYQYRKQIDMLSFNQFIGSYDTKQIEI